MPGPTAFVPQSGPVEPMVRKALSVFAMLDKVHLLVIKRFNDKFLSFALAVPSDSSLRGPSLQEILSADRAVWQAVHALIRDHSWSLSDSLNEVAFCRQDIPSALQPRPRAAHVPNPRAAPADPSAAPPPAPGNPRRKRTKSGRAATPGRPKAKATASSAKANQVPAAKAFDKSWHKKVNGVETCMRGALGRCTDPNCPRSHLPNGKPCGQKHTALEHLSTARSPPLRACSLRAVVWCSLLPHPPQWLAASPCRHSQVPLAVLLVPPSHILTLRGHRCFFLGLAAAPAFYCTSSKPS